MKKILFYLPSLEPAGGIERVVSTIANELVKKHEITILTKGTTKSFYELDGKTVRLSLDLTLDLDMHNRLVRAFQQCIGILRAVKALKAKLKKIDYDYIYITHPLSQLELLICGVEKNKIIISEHGASNNYNLVYRSLKKLTYKKCKAYIVPTTFDRDFYLKKGFPVVYIPHYKPVLRYCHTSRKENIVLNIGRFTNDKRQITLLQIWYSLPENIRSQWKLYLVGSGELHDELSAFIDDHGLNNEVFIFLPSQDVEQFYSRASIFALSSRSEGFGMVLLEAAGFGLPLISFDCPAGPRDIVTPENGFLVPDSDTETYGKCLKQLLTDHKLRESLSQGSLTFFDNWTNVRITNIWQKVFQ